MELAELLLIALIGGGPTIIDLFFQYGIHRHIEKGRPPCRTCALRAVISELDDIE